MMKREIRMVWGKAALVLSLLFVGGCSLKDAGPITEYSLSASPVPAVSSSRFRSRTLEITYPESLKEKLSRDISYSYSLSDRGVYQNSQWSNSSARLIQGTLIEGMEQSRIFKGVLSYASTAYADYRLESTVYDFSHHIRGEASYSIVSIKFVLIDTSTGKMVKTRKFSYKESTKTVDARGYVEATNIAMSRLVRDLAGWLR